MIRLATISFVKVGLSWPGKERAFSTAAADPSEVDVFEAEGGRGRLLKGNNVSGLALLERTARETVTLAYLDPPYMTERAHEAIVRTDAPKSGPLKARPKKPAFDDRWTSRGEYLEALGQRLVLIRELLAPHGSVVVHVDPKTSHYVKVLGDEIFGDDAFASEIVWRYRRWPSKTPNFQRVHDVLIRFRKDPRARPRWNQLYEPLAPSTLATWGTQKQRAEVDATGRRIRSTATREPTKGVPLGDVWDIGVIAPIARERTGYPSQKPEALLERLLAALTDPDDLVVDPYAGSGTTLAVAFRLGRRFVGIDASDVALDVAARRLTAVADSGSPAVRSAAASKSRA